MGPLPGNWLAASIFRRSHTWSPGAPILRVNCRELPLTAVILRQIFQCKLGPPCPPPAINLFITCCSDCTSRRLHMPKAGKPSLFLKMSLRSSNSSFVSISLDLTLATSSGLILHICLVMALSVPCRFVLVSGQVSLAWSMALGTQELYTWPWVL